MRIPALILLLLLASPRALGADNRWCGSLPLAVKLDASVPAASREAIRRGVLSWNAIGFGPLVKLADDRDEDPVTVVYVREPVWELCGRAPESVDGDGPCTKGRRIELYPICGTYMGAGWEEQITAHEVGHVLGIMHSMDEADIMFHRADRGQRFTAYEQLMLKRLYRGLEFRGSVEELGGHSP